MPTYTVKRGDNLSKIAQRLGANSWQAIYYRADNAGFRRLRPNPNLIYPGDILNVPEPRVLPPSRVPARASDVHPALRVFLEPMDDTPADQCCTLATPVECSYKGKKSDYTCPEGYVKLLWVCTEGTRLVGCGECSKRPATNCYAGPWVCSIWWWMT